MPPHPHMIPEAKSAYLACAPTPKPWGSFGDSGPSQESPKVPKARALFAGLVAMTKHTTTPVKVIVQLSAVWEAWHQAPHQRQFQDLLEDLTTQDRRRVTVLYISKNSRAPDAPGNEPQLLRRQRDAALTAWERANAMHDRKRTEWRETVDHDHTQIYKHAVQRLEKIYADKQHYTHSKAPRQQGKQTKQHKKDLVQQCRKPWTPHRTPPQVGTALQWVPLPCIKD